MIDFTQILPTGEHNAIPSNELIFRLQLNNSRELRKEIAEARCAGQIICAAPGGGYFRPQTKDELNRWVKTTSKKAASTFLALKYARAALNEIDGQMEMKKDTDNEK